MEIRRCCFVEFVLLFLVLIASSLQARVTFDMRYSHTSTNIGFPTVQQRSPVESFPNTLVAHLVISSSETNATPSDPGDHSDLNSWFPNFPPMFFESAKFAHVELTTSAGPSPTAPLTISFSEFNATVAPYPHDGSPASVMAAVQRAASDGADVIKVNVSCSQIQQDLTLAAAVEKTRLGGDVVICEGGPTPVPVQISEAGAQTNVSKDLMKPQGRAGAAYTSRVGEPADLDVGVLPGALVFEAAGEAKKKVVVSVKALGSDGGGTRSRWRQVTVSWISEADGVTVDEWIFVIRIN